MLTDTPLSAMRTCSVKICERHNTRNQQMKCCSAIRQSEFRTAAERHCQTVEINSEIHMGISEVCAQLCKLDQNVVSWTDAGWSQHAALHPSNNCSSYSSSSSLIHGLTPMQKYKTWNESLKQYRKQESNVAKHWTLQNQSNWNPRRPVPMQAPPLSQDCNINSHHVLKASQHACNLVPPTWKQWKCGIDTLKIKVHLAMTAKETAGLGTLHSKNYIIWKQNCNAAMLTQCQ